MRVTPADLAPGLAQAGGGVRVPVVAGDLKGLLVGALLRATVTSTGPAGTVLSLQGRAVTVGPGAGLLQPGAGLVVRLATAGTTPVLELVGRSAAPPAEGVAPGTPQPTAGSASPAPPTPTGPPNASPSPVVTAAAAPAAPGPTPRDAGPSPPPAARGAVAVVDVLSAGPGGTVVVRIDGRPEVATATEPLTPGGRYVVQVDRTPTGLTLRAPADAPNLPEATAAAILRGSPPPDLGKAVAPLLEELAAVAATANPGEAVASPLQAAADTVREAIRAVLPPDGGPPTAATLRNLVENGGLHYEAKLTRSAAGPAPTPAADPAHQVDRPSATALKAGESTEPDSSPAPPPRGGAPDLKDGLLRLVQAARELGRAAQVPAAERTLGGIEAAQAANVVAEIHGTPYVLQVPFPDGSDWRTLHLAVDRDARHPTADGGSGDGARVLLHVPLSGLGETWVDAGMSATHLRAVLYLDSPAARDRVRAELPGLEADLRGKGFGEVLLDVRPADSLPPRHRQQAAAMRAGRSTGGAVLDATA